MAKLSLIAGTVPRRVLITGLPGTGKTTLAATLAAKFYLDWFDIENGVETLLKLPQAYQDNVNLFRIPDSATYPIGSETMMKVFKNKKALICHLHGKVDCLICKKDPNAVVSEINFSNGYPTNRVMVVDTATQLGLSCLANTTRDKPVDYKPERDDWGALRKFTEFFASSFQAFPGNLIVIAHCMEAQLEDGKSKLVPNFGSAPMSAMFAKAFSHVIYCDVANKKHVAYSSSTYSNSILTKSRTGYEIEKQSEVTLLPLFKGLDTVEEIGGRIIEGEVTNVTSVEIQTPEIEVPKIEDKKLDSPQSAAIANLMARYGSKK